MHRLQTLRGLFSSIPSRAIRLKGRSAPGEAPPRRSRRRLRLALLAVCAFGIFHEFRTSAVQSWLFSRLAGDASYWVEPGPSNEFLQPQSGPFNERFGYTRLGEFRDHLEGRGFEIAEQARFSPGLARLTRWGFSPPFRGPVDTGLVIRDSRGAPLYDYMRRRPRFEAFEEIPLQILRSLLYIEDRHVLDSTEPRRNPVVDWSRFAGASAHYVGRKVGLPLKPQGGSTLATQIEKFRYSEGGRTDSATDKFVQMLSATLKVYHDGPDTSDERRQIVLDYLNSMPLAAAPGYGEVHGLGEGLRVWFGTELFDARRDLEVPGITDAKAAVYKQALALIYSARAPSRYLVRDRGELTERVDSYLTFLETERVIDAELASRAREVPLRFSTAPPPIAPPSLAEGKGVAEIRRRLMKWIGVRDFYTLERLHVEAVATIDGELQQKTVSLLRDLADPAFVKARGLHEERLLRDGDPAAVVYSLMLVEATSKGNFVRVWADNNANPLDINSGVKLELGSTAKLRTLVEYLQVVADVHAELTGAGPSGQRVSARRARDPISLWANDSLKRDPDLDLEAFLRLALERKYSASPAERFFTGGGLHTFGNFDPKENRLVLSVREATARSTNLVYVRLLRDLVRYYEARLPYDSAAVLAKGSPPQRRELLESIAEQEGLDDLRSAWDRLHTVDPGSLVGALLGKRAESPRHLAILFYAWNPGGDEAGLLDWLRGHLDRVTPAESRRLAKAYGNPELTLTDYAWLAGVHPLDLWCAGLLLEDPGMTWEDLLAASAEARVSSTAWLFKTRNRRAQDARLRTRMERDAFELMTERWKKVGFPFERMVPSYASAIGSSADKPVALADLMGILVNDGVRRPLFFIEEVDLAPGTPYYVSLQAPSPRGDRVLPPEVARVALDVLEGVVESGTASRLRGAFQAPDGSPLVVGGKTGSGDNRLKRTDADGSKTGKPINRTAAFVFFIGDRHFGVITATVDGPEAGGYKFTSSLPLAVLKMLAPDISLRASGQPISPTRRM